MLNLPLPSPLIPAILGKTPQTHNNWQTYSFSGLHSSPQQQSQYTKLRILVDVSLFTMLSSGRGLATNSFFLIK